MWTCDEKREDICEECEFILHDRMRNQTREKANRRVTHNTNPFVAAGLSGRTFWPGR